MTVSSKVIKNHNLIAASQKDDVRTVELLLRDNADVNFRDQVGNTALVYAAFAGNQVMVELLIAHDADINNKNIRNQTPLHAAARSGHRGVIEVLCSMNADINARDDADHAPLWYTMKYGSRESSQYLITKGAGELKFRSYKICFAGIQHPASMELIKTYFRQCNEINLIDTPGNDAGRLIRTMITEQPNLFYSCNDTSTTFTKISLLLNIPKVRIQEDPAQNAKWRESFVYDLKSPITVIHTGLDISSFGREATDKHITAILQSREFSDYKSYFSPPLTDYYWTNPIFTACENIQVKDIDLVFVGNIGEWNSENIREEMYGRFVNISRDHIDEIVRMILLHSTEFTLEISQIDPIIARYDRNSIHSLTHFYYEAIGRLRRINILRYMVEEFGEKHVIHLYGHGNIGELISRDHYKGYLYDSEAVYQVYRRSRMAVYSNSRPPLYNWQRFLETYRYRCVGIVDYNNVSKEELLKANGRIAEVLYLIPMIKNMSDLGDIVAEYLDEDKRERFVNKIINKGAEYTRVDISSAIWQYMRLFEYIGSRNDYSKYELDMLKYDSEVALLCDQIAEAYAEVGNIRRSDEYRKLGEYYLSILRDNIENSTEIAAEYASYKYLNGKYDDALQIIEAYCHGIDSGIILKAKIYERKKEYQKLIDVLECYETASACLMADSHFLQGLAMHNLGRYSSALDQYMKVAELNADYPLLNYYAGLTMFCMNDLDGARKYLQEAFRKTKDFPDIGILLGDVYFKLGDYDEAVKIYEYALRVVQGYEKIKDKEIVLIEKLAVASLFNGNYETSAGYLDIIISKYDENHCNAHIKLFLLLLGKGILNNFFSRELAWLHNNNVQLSKHYGELLSQFPEVLNREIKARVLNLKADDTVISDLRNFLQGIINH